MIGWIGSERSSSPASMEAGAGDRISVALRDEAVGVFEVDVAIVRLGAWAA